MTELVPVEGGKDAAWYALRDGTDSPVERYVVTTPASRAIVNRPEIVGHAYTVGLQRAAAAALASAPFRDALTETSQEQVCVLHVLRGGLSFGLREALGDGLGLTRHGSAFLSSQRVQAEDGTWSIHEDLYRKVDVSDDAVLLVGDVVATGTTLAHALEVVGEQAATTGRSLKHIILFTIGCENAEAILARCHERTTVVYLEGRFTVAATSEKVVPGTTLSLPPLAVPGTDLMRTGALLSPEFEASQDDSLAYPLERCAVYDAGSRAFDVPHYLEDVLDYWRGLEHLATEGLTLREALAQRWRADHPLVVGNGDAETLQALCAERIVCLRGHAHALARSAPTA